MRTDAAGRMFRTLMAGLFGFMSLAHGPVMAFAKAGMPAAHQQHHAAAHATHHAAHHAAQPDAAPHAGHEHASASHHAADHGQSPPHDVLDDEDMAAAQPPSPAVCHSFGCFTAVKPLPACAPAWRTVLLGKIMPPPHHPASPASLEPADPPPRLPA